MHSEVNLVLNVANFSILFFLIVYIRVSLGNSSALLVKFSCAVVIPNELGKAFGFVVLVSIESYMVLSSSTARCARRPESSNIHDTCTRWSIVELNYSDVSIFRWAQLWSAVVAKC